MAVRLEKHQEHALKVAEWLQTVPEVKRVLYPALPTDPGHAIWKRDMTGASGLFGVELHTVTEEALGVMMDSLKYFGMGFSWGGYESLIVAYTPSRMRSVTEWPENARFLRLHIGLESPKDLIADLDAGFGKLRAAMKNAA